VAKAAFWSDTDAEYAKAWGATGIRYPVSPRRKRWVLSVGGVNSLCAVANALSTPPGEYDRKIKTQGN